MFIIKFICMLLAIMLRYDQIALSLFGNQYASENVLWLWLGFQYMFWRCISISDATVDSRFRTSSTCSTGQSLFDIRCLFKILRTVTNSVHFVAGHSDLNSYIRTQFTDNINKYVRFKPDVVASLLDQFFTGVVTKWIENNFDCLCMLWMKVI